MPNYTSDVAADYTVLEKVRTWNTAKQEMFVRMLALLHGEENTDGFALLYQPGDYAKAALATLKSYEVTTAA